MNNFTVKRPSEYTNEELVTLFPTLHQASKLVPESFSTTAFLQDIKEEILKRMEAGQK